jgi:hypothetical protein
MTRADTTPLCIGILVGMLGTLIIWQEYIKPSPIPTAEPSSSYIFMIAPQGLIYRCDPLTGAVDVASPQPDQRQWIRFSEPASTTNKSLPTF